MIRIRDGKNLRTQGIIAIAFLLFGFGLATQLMSREQISERLTAQSEADLIQIVDSLDAEIKSMRSELTDQKIKLVSFKDTETGTRDILRRTKSEIADLKLLLGAEEAIGQGIVVEINDKQHRLIGFDLRQIIEELRASGAWAIAINNRRIDGRSSLWRKSGSVYLDGKKLAPLFKVEAVGNSDLLYQSITLPGGIRDALENIQGVNIKVARKKSLKLPTLKTSRTWRLTNKS